MLVMAAVCNVSAAAQFTFSDPIHIEICTVSTVDGVVMDR